LHRLTWGLPFRYAKGPFRFEGAFQSNAPPVVGGALHSAALLDPPNRLRSRDKNREYQKKAERKGEARHELCRDRLWVQTATYPHFDFCQHRDLTPQPRDIVSHPCIAQTFSSLAAPSTSLVGGFGAWEKGGAPSSAALMRRAAPPIHVMGGAAFVSAPPSRTRGVIVHERARDSAVAGSLSPPHVLPCLDNSIIPQATRSPRTHARPPIATDTHRRSRKSIGASRIARRWRRHTSCSITPSLKRTAPHDAGDGRDQPATRSRLRHDAA